MTHKDEVLKVLSDYQWHTFRELLDVYYKYTQRIHELRKMGYEIEQRTNASNKSADDYRLIHKPVLKAEPVKPKELFQISMNQYGEML